MSYFLITLFLGPFGVHKFMQKKYGMGFLYLFTAGLFGIGWIVDTVIAFSNVFGKKTTSHPGQQYLDSYSTARVYIDKYYNGLQEIELMWSVMYNLKIVNGEQADIFESKCRSNIVDLYQMLDVSKKCKYDSTMPPQVPAYVRLAMLSLKSDNLYSKPNFMQMH